MMKFMKKSNSSRFSFDDGEKRKIHGPWKLGILHSPWKLGITWSSYTRTFYLGIDKFDF